MRRFLMSAVLLAAAVIVQLTTINGLRLPGGGVPDLVLVVVAALGLASGPAPGAIAGFAAGLALLIAARVAGVPIPESFIASRNSSSSTSLPAVSIAASSAPSL